MTSQALIDEAASPVDAGLQSRVGTGRAGARAGMPASTGPAPGDHQRVCPPFPEQMSRRDRGRPSADLGVVTSRLVFRSSWKASMSSVCRRCPFSLVAVTVRPLRGGASGDRVSTGRRFHLDPLVVSVRRARRCASRMSERLDVERDRAVSVASDTGIHDGGDLVNVSLGAVHDILLVRFLGPPLRPPTFPELIGT